MSTTTPAALAPAPLPTAYEQSWYTILGVGGDVREWIDGYEQALTEEGIGTPQAWFTVTGHDLNKWLKPAADEDWFDGTLRGLMFPLTGLDLNKLAAFKIRWGDRWFDDVVQNVASRINP